MTASLVHEPGGPLPATAHERDQWIALAQCRDVDPDALFVTGAEQRRATRICHGCPVLSHCRAEALDNKVEFGIWGGLTERQRRTLLRNHPEITSWAEHFAAGGDLPG